MSIVFDFIKQVFAVPFGFILGLFYNLTNNYIVAIVLLTIVVKLCFLPNAINQKKNALKIKRTNLKLNKLKEIYSDEPEKLKQASKAVREKDGYKNGNLGCLSFIVQLIVLIGLFNVIYTPLTNVLRIDDTTIHEITSVMSANVEELREDSSTLEITILKEIDNYQEDLVGNNILSKQEFDEIVTFRDEYNFMGINLSHTPEFKEVTVLWLVPVLVLSVGVLSALYSFVFRKKHNPGKGKFTALDAFPFITPMIMFLFAFMFPAGVGFYWAVSNLLSFVETVVLNVIYNPYKVTLTEEDECELLSIPVFEPLPIETEEGVTQCQNDNVSSV